MADFPAVPFLGDPALIAISPMSMNSLGPSIATAATSTAWPSANLAIFVPFRVPCPVTVTHIGMGGGATATGNYDGGIYDDQGTRLISTGTQAKPSSTETIVDVTDTTFGPGLFYMAMSHDGTANIIGWLPGVPTLQLLGCRTMATAFVLPATATFATAGFGFLPSISLYLSTVT